MNKKYILAKQLIKIAKLLIADEEIFDEKNIEKQLKKYTIKEYKSFQKLHNNEWVMYPKNRNADVPDIYVKLDKNNKFIMGYNYANSDDKQDYEGTPQETISGLFSELASIKKDIEKAIVQAKNQMLDKEKQKKQEENQESDQGGGTEEQNAEEEKNKAVDDFLNNPIEQQSQGKQESGESEQKTEQKPAEQKEQ